MKFIEASPTPELEKWARKEIKDKAEQIKELGQETVILHTEIKALLDFLKKRTGKTICPRCNKPHEYVGYCELVELGVLEE